MAINKHFIIRMVLPMKRITKSLSILLILCTLFSILILPVMAASQSAYKNLSTSKYAKTYTLTTGTTIPYTTSSLSTRGTKTYGASKTAYINGTDELRVYKVGTTSGKDWAYVSYPINSSKRAYAYIPLSAITANNSSHAQTISSGKFYCSTRAGASTSSSYYVSKGDTVWLLSTSGNYCQIMYPTSNGTYRIAWCTKSVYNTYAGTRITLSSSSLTFTTLSSSKKVTASVTNGSGSTTWTSSNKKVATVSNGTITAKGAGTCTITATNNGKSATVKVTVKPASTSSTTTTNTKVIISDAEISSAATKYGISKNSNAYKALQSINTKYYNKLSSDKNKTLIFFFEGVGSNSSSSVRMNAMCVVVKGGKIVYLNKNCSTIPDYPFDPSKNEKKPMPTIKSGVYNFTTVNHQGNYAALNVTNASVVRHNSKSNYYSSTSSDINIHRRSTDSIASKSASWVNSAGCLIVGKTPNTKSTTSEYAKFIQAVGIVNSSGTAATKKQINVSGKVIVDRAYATTYLKNIGYTSGAISLLG